MSGFGGMTNSSDASVRPSLLPASKYQRHGDLAAQSLSTTSYPSRTWTSVRLLRDFQEEDPWFGPSPEGLARELSALAEQEPERISRLAPQFAHLRPTYIQWTLIGLGTALRNGKTVDWTSLVELLEDVAPVRPESTDHDEDNYGRWGWVRKEVASVLEAGFESSRFSASFLIFVSVWRIVEGLSDDHDPSQDYEERYGGSNMDPIILALNTTRGRAMLCCDRVCPMGRRDRRG